METQNTNTEKKIVEISLSKYPRMFNRDTRFWEDLYNHFENPKGINRAEWNLMCSKRDVSMWTKFNMKANASWRVSDVKAYFGIKGNGEKLLADFMEVYNQYHAFKKEWQTEVKNGNQIMLTD